MNPLIIQCSDYLKKNLDSEVQRVIKQDFQLPVYITTNYQIDVIYFQNNEYVVMIPDLKKGLTPSQIQKHIQKVMDVTDRTVILVSSNLDAYNRARYIEKKIPFIIPFNQMYLPQLGMDLREYYHKKVKKTEKLTPAAQAILLALIYKKVEDPVNANQLSDKLGYTSMTMGRGISLLATQDLVQIQKEGVIKWVTLNREGLNIESVGPLLINQVSTSVFSAGIPQNIPFVYSGLTALSNYSNLSQGDYTTIAIHTAHKEQVMTTGLISEGLLFDGQKVRIEFWDYDPCLFKHEQNADILSVYASLKDEYNDERILQATEAMMNRMTW